MSVSSPATGEGSRGRNGAAGRGDGRPSPEGPLDVELHHARWARFAGAAIACVVAPVAYSQLGGVGVVIGVAAVISALRQGLEFVATLRHPAGTIKVRRGQIVLPQGLCAGDPVALPVADVRHVLLLRRAVPYSAGGALLVVETAQGIFEYPRAWFASDDDPVRVAAMLRHLTGRS